MQTRKPLLYLALKGGRIIPTRSFKKCNLQDLIDLIKKSSYYVNKLDPIRCIQKGYLMQ